MRTKIALSSALAAALTPSLASAGSPSADVKAEYLLPFLLRPAIANDVVRAEVYLAPKDKGFGSVTTLTGGIKPFARVPDLGFLVKWELATQTPLGEGVSAAISNPQLIATWTPKLGKDWRLPLALAFGIPIGMGSGNPPVSPPPGDGYAGVREALRVGGLVRQALEGSLFSTNYFTAAAGAGLAYIAHGFTAQVEATFFQAVRVQGELADKDDLRTNSTFGIALGYRVAPAVNLGVEAHHQHWLSNPTVVRPETNGSEANRGQTTIGGGARFNVPLGPTQVFRPGFAVFFGVDAPMSAQDYRIVAIDLPIAF